MTEPLLIPDVDVPAAPSSVHKKPMAKGKSINWRKVLNLLARENMANFKIKHSRYPKNKELREMFVSTKEHCWEDGSPIRRRQVIYNQEVRRILGYQKLRDQGPLLEMARTKEKKRKAKASAAMPWD